MKVIREFDIILVNFKFGSNSPSSHLVGDFRRRLGHPLVHNVLLIVAHVRVLLIQPVHGL
jgi:hypothetical protein